MKVVLIYRRKRQGDYSIEELFQTIARDLRKYIEVVEYQTAGRWEILTDLWRLRKIRGDIYHITGDINYFALFLPRNRTMLTVHDIGHYLFGLRGLKRWIYKWVWLLAPLHAARAVVAVSSQTRDNVVRHLGFSARSVEVIENCHSALFKPTPRPFNTGCPVILQVGTKPYKNVPRLVQALCGIPCRLILIGPVDTPLMRQLVQSGVDYLNRVDLTHEELYRQYVECDIVSFVSIEEGFGVPIIEAQATGRPVITSSVSPMREVAGRGACLVNPLDVSEIRHGLLRIITDPRYRDELVTQGLHNAARYAPAAVTRRYLDLYRRLACS